MTKGGKRPNAGRKPIEETRVTLAVRVKRETKAELSDMAKSSNTSIGRVIDNLVNNEKEK